MDRTSEIIALVAAALRADSYAIPAEGGGVQIIVRPDALTVLEHPVFAAEAEDLPALGVFPATENQVHSASGGGVMDNALMVAIECVADGGDQPQHRALSALRTWAYVAVVHNAPLLAALREPATSFATRWIAPDQERGLDLPSCLLSCTLRHRTMYANPLVRR